jgi:hypothetical protein
VLSQEHFQLHFIKVWKHYIQCVFNPLLHTNPLFIYYILGCWVLQGRGMWNWFSGSLPSIEPEADLFHAVIILPDFFGICYLSLLNNIISIEQTLSYFSSHILSSLYICFRIVPINHLTECISLFLHYFLFILFTAPISISYTAGNLTFQEGYFFSDGEFTVNRLTYN